MNDYMLPFGLTCGTHDGKRRALGFTTMNQSSFRLDLRTTVVLTNSDAQIHMHNRIKGFLPLPSKTCFVKEPVT